MINKIELWLNILHYCFYKLDYKLHLLSNKLNPFLLLGKISAIRKKFDEEGISQESMANRAWGDRRYGFGIMLSGTGVVIIIFLLIWSIFLVINSLFNYPVEFSWRPFVGCLVLSYAVCYWLIFMKEKYLKHFRRFDKWAWPDQRKYGLLSFAFIVAVVAFWIYSFRLLPGL